MKRIETVQQPTIAKRSEGHVYVLTSPACGHIKIGGTDYAPLKRIQEINNCEPYRALGPWHLHDFRQVADWRKVEASLHYVFRDRLVSHIVGQRELFSLSPQEASKQLEQIDEALLSKKPRVDRMFQQHDLAKFLASLFRSTALLNWLDLQGAWTLSLFPSTSGGRYYTINIGPHEVAYATVPRHLHRPAHMLHMDRLIHDFDIVSDWLKKHDGGIADDNYITALPRSASVHFSGSFKDAQQFLALDGVRRALIAYWTEALVSLQERGKTSVFARHHNWNAVAEIKRRMDRLEM